MLDGDFNFLNMPQSRLLFTLISLDHIQDATWWLRFHDDAFDIIATFRIIISKHFTLSAHSSFFLFHDFSFCKSKKKSVMRCIVISSRVHSIRKSEWDRQERKQFSPFASRDWSRDVRLIEFGESHATGWRLYRRRLSYQRLCSNHNFFLLILLSCAVWDWFSSLIFYFASGKAETAAILIILEKNINKHRSPSQRYKL